MIVTMQDEFVLVANAANTAICANMAFMKRRPFTQKDPETGFVWKEPLVYRFCPFGRKLEFEKMGPSDVLSGFWSSTKPGTVSMINEPHAKIYLAYVQDRKLLVADSPSELMDEIAKNVYTVYTIGSFDPLLGKIEEPSITSMIEAIYIAKERMEREAAQKEHERRRKDIIEREARKMAKEMVKNGEE